MLSFALVVAGAFDGREFRRIPAEAAPAFYAELKPISDSFQAEALRVNGLDRQRLVAAGEEPQLAKSRAAQWVTDVADGAQPVLVAYPLSFDWAWLYWYFIAFAGGSPFKYSSCYDVKTAFSVKGRLPISAAGQRQVPAELQSKLPHTHHALDDARQQADVFANIFEWSGSPALTEIRHQR
jgi:hypothetical protein